MTSPSGLYSFLVAKGESDKAIALYSEIIELDPRLEAARGYFIYRSSFAPMATCADCSSLSQYPEFDMATIRINAGQWNVLSGDQQAQVLAILQLHGSLQPDDTIEGDSSVEPIYSPQDTDGATSAGNREDYENEAICRAGYAVAVAACQSIAPPGSTACIAVATVARNLCREAVGLRSRSAAR